MLKNIQKNLLLKNPLIWNSRIIPFALVGIIFQIVFFIAGYIQGEINFEEEYKSYFFFNTEDIIVFTSILISIFTIIIWLVLYSRNNAFKSFYPKSNMSLFKEWLLILLFFAFNTTYTLTYMYGKDVKARSYFSREEIIERSEIISGVSIFLRGELNVSEYSTEERKNADGTIDYVQVKVDSFNYNNKKYPIKSLLNKKITSFKIYSTEQDSLRELKIKKWLLYEKRDSIKLLFASFLKISKEHNLKANITAEKWFNLVYKAPDFANYIQVGTSEHSFYNENYDEEVAVANATEYAEAQNEIDTFSQIVKIENGYEQLYSKYYVPYDAIHNSYSKIIKAYEDPNVNFESLTFFFCFIICLSIITFSFKVTSGKNWLIALVSLGIVGIISGIISVLIRHETAFSIIYLFVFGCLAVYFLIISSSKSKKGISGITLNQLLWMFPVFFPLVYFIVYEIIKETSGYNDYQYDELVKKQFPQVEFMENHTIHMLAINIFIIFIFMFVMSRQIKKWKGIPEA